MRIENKTVLTKDLMWRFSFANLIHKFKFNLIIFPLLMVACAIILYNQNGTMLYVQILLVLAVAVPLVLVLVNMGMFALQVGKHPQLDCEVKTAFTNEGFYVNVGKDNETLVKYDYLKECVEYRKMFIIYFKGAAPMIIEKSGFSFGDASSFKAMMRRVLPKKRKQLK